MADLYELAMFDTNGIKQNILQGWNRFEFTQRVNAPWNHALTIEMSSEDERASFFRDSVDVDWMLQAHRIDPLTNQKDLVYEGFNRTVVDQARVTGDIIFNLYGSGYTELLKRSVVVPPAGSENSNKQGVAETIAKEFVDEQQVNPVDTTRVMPGLTVEANAATGEPAEYSARYTNLFTVVSRIAEQGALDFGIVGGAVPGTFEFQMRHIWGLDRNVENIDGNPPTIFDMGFGNMSIPIFSKNFSEQVTFVYVGGAGQGTGRLITEVTDTITVALSPWNRREAFVNASQENTLGGLWTHGKSYLNEHSSPPSFNFKILQTPGTRWLEDWELGDIVTARYFGNDFLKKVDEVSVAITSNPGSQREYIQVELLDIIPAWLLGITGFTELGETTILG